MPLELKKRFSKMIRTPKSRTRVRNFRTEFPRDREREKKRATYKRNASSFATPQNLRLQKKKITTCHYFFFTKGQRKMTDLLTIKNDL